MTRRLLLLLTLGGAPGTLAAQRSGWTTTQRAAAGASLAAIAADCGSTAAFLRHGEREVNPLLPARPSPARLAATCAAGAGLTFLVGSRLRRVPRLVFFVAVTAVELTMTAHNVRLIDLPLHR